MPHLWTTHTLLATDHHHCHLCFENKWTDFNANWHKSSRGKGMKVDLGDHEVKAQGHRRPKLCLEAWRRHHSRSLEHAVSDGNVAFEKGGAVLHSFNCTAAFVGYASCWRTCYLYWQLFSRRHARRRANVLETSTHGAGDCKSPCWTFLSASLYFSKRGAYRDRMCRDVVGRWLSRACTVAKRCILGL